MKNKKLIVILLSFALVVVVLVGYTIFITRDEDSSCRHLGQAAYNASMGPNGDYGNCCLGLTPKGQTEKVGGGAICQQIVPLPWIKE